MDFDTTVKLAIYQKTADTGIVSNSSEVAALTGFDESDVLTAFLRLQTKRLLVPEANNPGRIRMAPPFSGVPTAFPVEARGKRYYANCVWDAFGVAAALHSDALIPAPDGHTGERLTLEVKNGRPVSQPYVAHFAVPAALWWKDIVFT